MWMGVFPILLMSQVFSSFANAQERAQARSMVISRSGIVATSQTLASQAGAQILARGGSAVDAAIAANAVLSVVEPMMNGLGGDLFAIIRDGKTGKLTGINASGWSPKALMPVSSMNSATTLCRPPAFIPYRCRVASMDGGNCTKNSAADPGPSCFSPRYITP